MTTLVGKLLPLVYGVRRQVVFEMIRKQMGGTVPFARHVGVRLDEVGEGAAEAALGQREEVSNHLKTMHAGALFALGETASGAAMAGAFAPVIMQVRPVAANARIDYLRPARGEIRARARTEEDAGILRDRLKSEGVARFGVRVGMMDGSGTEVATMNVDWQVKNE